MHDLKDPEKLLGAIEINPRRKFKGEPRIQLSYFVRKMRRKPEALQKLRELNTEIFNKTRLQLREIERHNGTIQFIQMIKIISCCALWKAYLDNESELALKEKAEIIAEKLEIDPVTVSIYTRASTIKEVVYEAHKISRILLASKNNITERWLSLLEDFPDLTPLQRAKRISKDIEIEASTVSSYARGSSNKQVRNEGFKASKQLFDQTYNITQKWEELIKNKPNLKPSEKASIIANGIQLKPSNIASQAKNSKNPQVKLEAYRAFRTLKERDYAITPKWQKLIRDNPELSPKEKAENIASKLDIQASTVARYGSSSIDYQVKKEAIKAAAMIGDSHYNITDKWRNLINHSPELTPEQKALNISKEIGIKSISVAGYALKSYDTQVKYEANKALKTLAASNYNITETWIKLIKNYPKMEPWGRAGEISKIAGIKPSTISTYAKSSTDERVKSDAYIAFNHFMLLKHDITKKWKEKITIHPEISPLERLSLISEELGIKTTSISSYGLNSPSKTVKKEAGICYNLLMLKKYQLTDRWKELIKKKHHLSPKQKAEEIAQNIKIGAVSVAGYARTSDDDNVRGEARIALNKLLIEKYTIEKKWEILNKENPELAPHEIAIIISKTLKASPVSVASYAIYSSKPQIKKQANLAYNILRESSKKITRRWKKLKLSNPRMKPYEIAKMIAGKLNIKPITVAGYGRASKDGLVKSEAMKAYYDLSKSI